MATKKISDLTSGAPAQNADEFVIARSGSNYKLTLANIINAEATTRAADDANLAADIATEITNRTNADSAIIADLNTEIADRQSEDALLIPLTYLDTDGTLAANSDSKIATQKASKTYIDAVAATIPSVASDGDAVAKVSTTKALTPANLSDANFSASTTFKGLIELATQAEANTGTDAIRAITPATMIAKKGAGVDSFMNANSTTPNTAAGTEAVSLGGGNTASGNYSISLGRGNTSSGANSLASGHNSESTASYSFAFGFKSSATALGAVAIGVGNSGASQKVISSGQFAYNLSASDSGSCLGAAADYSAILGGLNNEIQAGTYSAIIGGRAQITGGNGSIALGLNNRTGLNQSYTTYLETVRILGGNQRGVKTTTISGATTLDHSVEIIPLDSSGGIFTIDLPASPVNGQYYVFIQVSGVTSVVTIDGNGKNIDGAGTTTVSASTYSKKALMYIGITDEWVVVG